MVGMKKAFPLCILLFLTACAYRGVSRPVSEEALGTICTINLFDRGELYPELFDRLHELEGILSANREGSDLDRINQNAGLNPVKVRPELIKVLERAIAFAEKSSGFFDPSVGPLVKLWGIGSDRARVPDGEEIREALGLINYRDIEINREQGTVFLTRERMALDLGAIAKGYAADELVKLLVSKGAERAIIDLGGDIFAFGEKKADKSLMDLLKDLTRFGKESDESFWRIGIQDPRESRGFYTGILSVKNKGVVTSGTYERFFEEGGRRYHHIFSLETGFPADNGLISVTVVADKCIDADALSTAAFALGWERGRELIASVPGAEGIFIFDDLTVRLTHGLADSFSLSAGEYHEAR
jgi:thiamine biosynthesis lipoprotein